MCALTGHIEEILNVIPLFSPKDVNKFSWISEPLPHMDASGKNIGQNPFSDSWDKGRNCEQVNRRMTHGLLWQ